MATLPPSSRRFLFTRPLAFYPALLRRSNPEYVGYPTAHGTSSSNTSPWFDRAFWTTWLSCLWLFIVIACDRLALHCALLVASSYTPAGTLVVVHGLHPITIAETTITVDGYCVCLVDDNCGVVMTVAGFKPPSSIKVQSASCIVAVISFSARILYCTSWHPQYTIYHCQIFYNTTLRRPCK